MLLPIRLVKGVEHYTTRGPEYSFKELLQVVKSTGRPGMDTSARLLLMVNQSKRFYYRHFLSEPFIVESSLAEPAAIQLLADMLNYEISQGNIREVEGVIRILQKTLLAVRINLNPSYYGLVEVDTTKNHEFLASLANQAIKVLEISGCITAEEKYLEVRNWEGLLPVIDVSYKTIGNFDEFLEEDTSLNGLIQALSLAEDLIEVHHEESKRRHMHYMSSRTNHQKLAHLAATIMAWPYKYCSKKDLASS